MFGRADSRRYIQQEIAQLKDENQAIREELDRLREAIRSLDDLQQRLEFINPQSDVIELVDSILSCALEAADSENGTLMLLDEETGELVFAHVKGPGRDKLQGFRLPPGKGIASWVATTKTPKMVNDVRLEPLFSPLVDKAINFTTNAVVCVPLSHATRTLGVIEVVNTRNGRLFVESDLSILLLLARLAAVALVRAEGSR